jgi:hypothetical protein
MLLEYSLDPEIFESVEQFQRIIEACGISEGRYIANLPSRRWEEVVFKWLRAKDPNRARRAEELLTQCKRRHGLIPSRVSKCPEWIEATLEQHKSQPFKAVITEKEIFPARISLNDLSVDTDPWKSKRGDRIPIDAVSIGNIAAPLLRISKEIVLLDPYFDPKKARYHESLAQLVKHSIHDGKKPERFECHCKINLNQVKQSPADTADAWSHRFDLDCRTRLPEQLPSGFQIKIVLWDEIPGKEIMHARYVMTELAALNFEHGLDDSERDATTDVSWLSPEVHQSRWADLQLNSTRYRRIRSIAIVGKGAA